MKKIKLDCEVEGCERKIECLNRYCLKHYKAWKRNGDPVIVRRVDGSLEDRFFHKVNKNGPIPEYRPDLGPCWIWMGGHCESPGSEPYGYGSFGITSNYSISAHRWSYAFFKGPIPNGLVIDHLCRRTDCVNPIHLEAVTQSENVRRSRWCTDPVTHCDRGHRFTPENTYTYKKTGYRYCKICHKALHQKYQKENRYAKTRKAVAPVPVPPLPD